MNKIMIIDDNYFGNVRREDTYLSILGERFEIEPIAKAADLTTKIETIVPSLYLVDIVLTGWRDPKTQQAVDSLDVLRKLNKDVPVILVSNEFENMIKNNQLTGFLNQIIEDEISVKSFITWGLFTEAYMNNDIEKKESIIAQIEIEILRTKKEHLQREANLLDTEGVPIGIITALREELEPFLDRVRETITARRIHNVAFTKAEITTNKGKQVRIVCASQDEMGMVDAALISSIMIQEFKTKHLFMIGVCGGRPKEKVKIGDIMVPNESVAWQRGKIEEKGMIPDVAESSASGGLQQALTSNSKKCQEILVRLFKEYQNSYFVKHRRSPDSVDEPSINYCAMACGDVIISKDGMLDEIATQVAKRKLSCVEMESFSVLRTHHYFPHVRASVIKCVMDLTTDKSDKFKDYACFMAAGFIYELIYQELYAP